MSGTVVMSLIHSPTTGSTAARTASCHTLTTADPCLSSLHSSSTTSTVLVGCTTIDHQRAPTDKTGNTLTAGQDSIKQYTSIHTCPRDLCQLKHTRIPLISLYYGHNRGGGKGIKEHEIRSLTLLLSRVGKKECNKPK